MAEATRRGAKEGIGFGLIAGVIFAVIEFAGAAMMGTPPVMLLRMFASVVLGPAALQATPAGAAIVVGLIVHLVLSAAFGLFYGFVNGGFSTATQTRWGRQVGLGLLFGIAIWFVDFQIIARLIYPWFLTSPQFMQAIMHAVFFGLPLSLMYAGAERRTHHIHHEPTPA